MDLRSGGEQEDIYRLVRENNKMLHAMKRRALWGGLFKLLFWAAVILGPLWFYMTYVHDTVQQMMQTVNQIQGTGASAQAQFSDLQDAWKQFQQNFSGSGGDSSSTSTK